MSKLSLTQIMTKEEKKRMEDYSKIKEKQEKFLDKVFEYPEYSFEKCIAMGGLAVGKSKVVVKDKARGCDEPPIHELFNEYDFENEVSRKTLIVLKLIFKYLFKNT